MGGRGTSFSNKSGQKGTQQFKYKTGKTPKWIVDAVKNPQETTRQPFKTDGTMKLNNQKIKVFNTTDPMKDDVLRTNLGKVKDLQRKMLNQYGIDTKAHLTKEKSDLNFFGGSSNSGTIAVYFDNNIVFNMSKFRNLDSIREMVSRQMDSNHFAKADKKYITTYTVTHEYGHFVEDVIIKKRLEKKGLEFNFMNERKEANAIRKEILAINKEKYKNDDTSVSRYGLTNPL